VSDTAIYHGRGDTVRPLVIKAILTIVATPLLPMVLRACFYRLMSLTWSQGLATYLLVLLPSWIALWRPGVPPIRRAIAFGAGAGNGVLLFLVGDLVKGWVIVRHPPDWAPVFHMLPFLGYQALTIASWVVAAALAYWVAAPRAANSERKPIGQEAL
jgi:hypothetical protein